MEVVAVRHVAFEHLGVFEDVLTERGYRVTYLDAVQDRLLERTGDPTILVLLGGPVGAGEDDSYPFLQEEKQLVLDRITRGRPSLGICLGAQVIAAALAAKVYPAETREIGWGRVRLTDAGAGSPLCELSEPVLHWHGDTFDLPAGAVHLASTPACRNQAFAVGTHTLGLQFHAEVTGEALESWLVGHAHEIAHTPGVTAVDLRAAGRRQTGAARQGRAFLTRWLDALERDDLLT